MVARMPRLLTVAVAVTQLSLCTGVAVADPAATAATAAPPALNAPHGNRILLVADATGTQDYVCTATAGAYAWTLRGPDAILSDRQGKPVGRHFVGPTWEWSDKSQVVGALVAKADAPDATAVPWLLLSVKEHHGDGVLGPVRFVQRLGTRGGKAPAAGCDAAHAAAVSRVPYSAHYVFLGI
jgi:hypothetical protein